jgi:hypothetical protein
LPAWEVWGMGMENPIWNRKSPNPWSKMDAMPRMSCSKDVVLGESHTTLLTTKGEFLTTGASSYAGLGNGGTPVDQLCFEPVERRLKFSWYSQSTRGASTETQVNLRHRGLKKHSCCTTEHLPSDLVGSQCQISTYSFVWKVGRTLRGP